MPVEILVQGDFMKELLAVERTISYFIPNDDVGHSARPGKSHVKQRCMCVYNIRPVNITYFVINNLKLCVYNIRPVNITYFVINNLKLCVYNIRHVNITYFVINNLKFFFLNS
jgi:hypothetical protein